MRCVINASSTKIRVQAKLATTTRCTITSRILSGKQHLHSGEKNTESILIPSLSKLRSTNYAMIMKAGKWHAAKATKATIKQVRCTLAAHTSNDTPCRYSTTA